MEPTGSPPNLHGGNVRKTPLALASIAAAALALTVIPAQAADNPGLVPTSSWNSGQKEITIGLEAPMTGKIGRAHV